ncbi:MAG: FecR domain-containing protein [Lachnospiraceae bacterium]
MKRNIPKKWLLIILPIVLALVAAVIILIMTSKTTYRLIKVNSFNGTIYVDRETKEGEEVLEAFEGLQLLNGDRVSVENNSFLELLMDEDKHMGAEENTAFLLYADGDENAGRIQIEMLCGKALFEIEHPLNEDSAFEVVTPNATLSVRGTIFSVAYDDVNHITTVEVVEGTVWLEDQNGSKVLQAGETIRIGESGEIAEGISEEPAEGMSGEMVEGEEILQICQQYLTLEDPYYSELQIIMNIQTPAFTGSDNIGIYITDPTWGYADSQFNAEAERMGNDYLFPHRAEIDQYFVEYGEEAIQILASGGEPEMVDVTDWFPESLTIQGDDDSISFQVTKVEMILGGNYSPAYNADGELNPAPPNSYLEGDNYVSIGSVDFWFYGIME